MDSGVGYYAVAMDGGQPFDVGYATAFTWADALPAGLHTFEVIAVDNAGNGGAPAVLNFSIESPTTYALSVSCIPTSGGSVSPDGGIYDENAVVQVTATPATWYRFDHWEGDGSGTSPTTSLTMGSNKTIAASFTKLVYTVAAQVHDSVGGTVSPAAGTYEAGTYVTITATPASGYEFLDWEVGSTMSFDNPLSLLVDGDKTVTAWFYKASYAVEYEITGSATSVSLTYANADGGTSQVNPASVPWKSYFTAHNGDFLYMSAQNNGDHGTVTVTIYVDGKAFKTSSSSGAYVVATASGSL